MKLRGRQALEAAETFEGVTLYLDRTPSSPQAIRALVRRNGISANDLPLWASVSPEVYHRVRRTPCLTHHGPPALRK